MAAVFDFRAKGLVVAKNGALLGGALSRAPKAQMLISQGGAHAHESCSIALMLMLLKMRIPHAGRAESATR